jgi:hypothetical protein
MEPSLSGTVLVQAWQLPVPATSEPLLLQTRCLRVHSSSQGGVWDAGLLRVGFACKL